MTRLQTYRAFLAAMSPSSNPAEAINRGFYVDPPDGGVWSTLASRLELEPTSTHLVLGGIGSGKTSGLLRTKARLEQAFSETGDAVWYCDVSQHHALTASPETGVLFTLTGLLAIAAGRRNKIDLQDRAAAVRAIERLAHGFVEFRDLPEDEEPQDEPPDDWHPQYPVQHPGVLKPPQKRTIDWRLRTHTADLEQVLHRVPGEGRATIVMFDSLDRLPQPASFKTLVEDDIRALKSAGVGVVVVGPVRYIVGNDRSLTDLFDYPHFQLATDSETEAGMTFLCEILRRRAEASGLLDESCLPMLARASGGVLRDLIALAKRSAEEAYAMGHPKITANDVSAASEAFGRSLALGLDDDQVKILKNVATSGGFVVRGERELSLLETRRVLLYPGNQWRVHPTLVGLLGSMAETGA